MPKGPIKFELFAPYNDDVTLVGSWNKWQPIPMKRNDKGYWNVDVPLDDGCYEYQFDLISKSYGSPDELCRLSDQCHARGLRVIYDGVYNQMQEESALTRIDYTYWFYKENPDDKDLQFGPKFNFDHFDDNLKVYPAREYVIG